MHKVIETSTSSLSAHRTLTNSQIKMKFFMQEYRVLAFLVACCVCNIPGGHTKSTGNFFRGKRQSKEECTSSNEYWNSTTSSCEYCQCPAGQRNTAELCGFGFIVGRYQCVDCPNGKFRGPSDHHSTCRQCTVCDPDAIVVFNCTRTEDTQCVCEKGLGTIRDRCVSCRYHLHADGCQTEDVNTTPAPHRGDSDQDDSNPDQDLKESKNGQERGLSMTGLAFLCFLCGIVFGIAILALGIRLPENKKRFSNQETMTDDSTIGSVSPPDDVQSQRSQENAPTPGSASDRETDVNGAAMLQNGSSHSITANGISTSGEGPSSNSCPVDDQPTRSQEDAPTPASANNRETDAPVHQNTEATLQNGSSNSINANGISTSEEGLSSYSHPVDVQPKRSQEDALTPASASDRETDELLTGNGAATLQNGPSNSMNSNQETFMLDSVPSYSTQVANLTTEETTDSHTTSST